MAAGPASPTVLMHHLRRRRTAVTGPDTLRFSRDVTAHLVPCGLTDAASDPPTSRAAETASTPFPFRDDAITLPRSHEPQLPLLRATNYSRPAPDRLWEPVRLHMDRQRPYTQTHAFPDPAASPCAASRPHFSHSQPAVLRSCESADLSTGPGIRPARHQSAPGVGALKSWCAVS